MFKCVTTTGHGLLRSQRNSIFQHYRGCLWSSTRASIPILTLYTKHVCPLCDEAKIVLESYKNRFEYEEVDITAKGNEDWFKKYRYEIPVFHLNGAFLMKHRVDEKLLEKELRRLEKEGMAAKPGAVDKSQDTE